MHADASRIIEIHEFSFIKKASKSITIRETKGKVMQIKQHPSTTRLPTNNAPILHPLEVVQLQCGFYIHHGAKTEPI